VCKTRITSVEEDCVKLHEEIERVDGRLDKMDEVIEECRERITICEEQLAEAMKKLEKLDELEIIVMQHTVEIGKINDELVAQKTAFEEYQDEVAEKFRKERAEREKVDVRLKELEDYVHNRLTVTTDQVIVGEGDAAITLTVVLGTTEQRVGANEVAIAKNIKVIKKHGEEIAQKAGIHVEPTVEEHTKSIKDLIEVTGAGGGGARMADLEARIAECTKGVKNAIGVVDDVKEQMLEKCDKSRVDEKIESKYEEIIDHLQSALSGAGDDEDEFKRISLELQEICQNLTTTKADKRDLLEVKEQVLFDSRVREQVEQLRDFIDQKINKEDVVAGLNTKPDRDEMEKLLKELSTTMKKSVAKAMAQGGGDGDGGDGDYGGGGGGGGSGGGGGGGGGSGGGGGGRGGGRGGGKGLLNTQSIATPGTGGSAGNLYANLVWKRGKNPNPPPVLANKGNESTPSFGGGFRMLESAGGSQPALRPGRSADLVPMMPRQQDGPANPGNSFVVGVDGLIYHGAAQKAKKKKKTTQ
jgi:hypothetical protein